MPARALLSFLFTLLTGAACTLHSTATHWNGRTAADGRPVWMTTTTIYGVNLFVLFPFVGDTRADALVDAATAEIRALGGDHLRVAETEAMNYWYAIPLVTWFVSPISGSVSIEFVPSPEALAKEAAEERVRQQKAAARRDTDHSHVIPEAKR